MGLDADARVAIVSGAPQTKPVTPENRITVANNTVILFGTVAPILLPLLVTSKRRARIVVLSIVFWGMIFMIFDRISYFNGEGSSRRLVLSALLPVTMNPAATARDSSRSAAQPDDRSEMRTVRM